MWTLPPLEITDERARRARASGAGQDQHPATGPASQAILLAAEGVANRRIAEAVGMHENYVGIWRRRFESERLGGTGGSASLGTATGLRT